MWRLQRGVSHYRGQCTVSRQHYSSAAAPTTAKMSLPAAVLKSDFRVFGHILCIISDALITPKNYDKFIFMVMSCCSSCTGDLMASKFQTVKQCITLFSFCSCSSVLCPLTAIQMVCLNFFFFFFTFSQTLVGACRLGPFSAQGLCLLPPPPTLATTRWRDNMHRYHFAASRDSARLVSTIRAAEINGEGDKPARISKGSGRCCCRRRAGSQNSERTARPQQQPIR